MQVSVVVVIFFKYSLSYTQVQVFFGVRMSIPVIDDFNFPTNIFLQKFSDVGLAYVKIRDFESIKKDIDNIYKCATLFFHSDEEHKLQWQLNEEIEGYINRVTSSAPHIAQQFYFRPDKPIGPFLNHKTQISKISQQFEMIGNSLLSSLFKYFEIKSKHYEDIVLRGFRHSFSFAYYPYKSIGNPLADLHPHKDFGLITVLYVNEPGLEAYINNAWSTIPVKPGYAIVNIGNSLELMLGRQVHSPLHQIQRSKDKERMSLVYFIEPNLITPITDYTTNQVLFSSYAKYFDFLFSSSQNSINYIEPDNVMF